jgi:Amt family ammonium transporter
MYEAKQAGKDTFRFYDSEMRTNSTHNFNLENALPIAIENNQLYLEYQPKVTCGSNKIVGFEALIRWQHPEYGLIPPNEFIPIIESSNIIIEVGEWVIREAVSQLATLKSHGINDVPIAVNISGKHLEDPNLLDYILKTTKEFDVDTKLLEVELTESVLTGDSSTSRETISTLAENGIKLYIDDFGTGYSSLSYLSKFPVHVLKIDRAFIRNCTTNEDDSAICLAIISLARSLKMEIVAEGVETDDQLLYLQNNDCNAYQGYLFSKPLGKNQMLSIIEDGVS